MTGAINSAMGSAALAWRRTREQERIAPSFAMALVMHLALFAAMSLAVRWKTEAEAPAMAELWSALPPIAAPVAPPPPPPPPEPVAEPKPEPKVEPPPDIAVETKKAPPKREEPKKEEPKREEPKKIEVKKEAPKKVEKVEAKPPPKPEEQVDRERERILAQADATRATATGAPRSGAGNDASYAAAVTACVRPNIIFAVPEGTPASVYALFKAELLPDGTVARVSLLKPSGLAGYDDAAMRAIRRCDPFPRKPGVLGSWSIDLTLKPVDTQ